MGGSQHALKAHKGGLEEACGLLVLTEVQVEACQTMEGAGRLGMGSPQRRLPQGEGALQDGFGLSVLSAVAQIASRHMEETSGLGEGEGVLLGPLGTKQGMGQAPFTALPLPGVGKLGLGKGP